VYVPVKVFPIVVVPVKETAEATGRLEATTGPTLELCTAVPVVGGTVATGVTSNLIYLPTSDGEMAYVLDVAPLIAVYVPVDVVASSHLNVETP
jgi:hypothetical protein